MSYEKLDELFNIYLKAINTEIKTNFKNSKQEPPQLIVLLYDDSENIRNFAKENGITVIGLSQLIDIDLDNVEYQISQTDCHPNSKAWDVIVPALVKELNL